MRKAMAAAAAAAALALTLCGCTSYITVEGDAETHVDTDCVRVFIDEQTGVNYLVFHSVYAGGMTVRLDENGEVMVTR